MVLDSNIRNGEQQQQAKRISPPITYRQLPPISERRPICVQRIDPTIPQEPLPANIPMLHFHAEHGPCQSLHCLTTAYDDNDVYLPVELPSDVNFAMTPVKPTERLEAANDDHKPGLQLVPSVHQSVRLAPLPFGPTTKFNKKCCSNTFVPHGPLQKEYYVAEAKKKTMIKLEGINAAKLAVQQSEEDGESGDLIATDEYQTGSEVVEYPVEPDEVYKRLQNASYSDEILEKAGKLKNNKNKNKKECFFEDYFYAEFTIREDLPPAKLPFERLTNIGSSRCNICLNFVTAKLLVGHIFDHLWEHVYQPPDTNLCVHCLEAFPNSAGLVEHYDMINQFAEFTCMICIRSFPNDELRMQHMRTHHFRYSMPYYCTLCKYRSSLMTQFASHFETYHLLPFCHFCNHVFDFGHQLFDSNSNLDPYRMEYIYCNLSEQVERHLQQHLALGRVFGCESCALSFVAQSDLIIHQRLAHTQKMQQTRGLKEYKFEKYSITEEQARNAHAYSQNEEIEKLLGKMPTGEMPQNKSVSRRKKTPISTTGLRRPDYDDSDNGTQESCGHSQSSQDDDMEASSSISDVPPSSTTTSTFFSTGAPPTIAPVGSIASQPIIISDSEDDTELEIYFDNQLLSANNLTISEMENGLFECNECFERFELKQEQFETHFALNDSLDCDVCGSKFRCREAFQLHLAHVQATQIGDRPDLLMIMNEKFDSKNMPENKHLSVCTSCTMRFHNAKQLSEHVINSTHIAYNNYPIEDDEDEDTE